MFFGLKKVKKVKPAKVKSVEQKVIFPTDYLFWGEREIVNNDAGVEYAYIERECFLGNTDEDSVATGNAGGAFAMRKLTGKSAGELFFPKVVAGDFLIKVPHVNGDAEYQLVIERFSLGDKVADSYTLGEIQTFAANENTKARKLAKESASKVAVELV